MSQIQPLSQPPGNRLLGHLPVGDQKRLLALLEPVSLKPPQIIYRVRSSIDYVYFPVSGIISAMTVMEDGRAIEVATIGNEGLVGLSAFLGSEESPYEVMVQVQGQALRMPAHTLRKEAGSNSPLRQVLLAYYTAFSVQVSYSVACNGLHKVEERCCRWLLMTQDRVGSNVLPLTHEFLAIMLGVRRASVTDVLSPLQQRGLIRNGRGTIEIIDRAGLEAKACECYGAINQEFSRQFS